MQRIAIRGRGRGAAGLRGTRGFSGGFRETGCYRKPVEVLYEVCHKNNWGEPVFQLLSAVQGESGDGAPQLFLYKVTIPGLPGHYNHFQGNKLCRFPDEAKQLAAEYVLMQLGVPMDAYEQAYYEASPQPQIPIY